MLSEAVEWISATPFLVTRYPKFAARNANRPEDYGSPGEFARHVLHQELQRRPDLPPLAGVAEPCLARSSCGRSSFGASAANPAMTAAVSGGPFRLAFSAGPRPAVPGSCVPFWSGSVSPRVAHGRTRAQRMIAAVRQPTLPLPEDGRGVADSLGAMSQIIYRIMSCVTK